MALTYKLNVLVSLSKVVVLYSPLEMVLIFSAQ